MCVLLSYNVHIHMSYNICVLQCMYSAIRIYMSYNNYVSYNAPYNVSYYTRLAMCPAIM